MNLLFSLIPDTIIISRILIPKVRPRLNVEQMSIPLFPKKWNVNLNKGTSSNLMVSIKVPQFSSKKNRTLLQMSQGGYTKARKAQDCIQLLQHFKASHEGKGSQNFGSHPFGFYFHDFETRIFLVASAIKLEGRTEVDTSSQEFTSALQDIAKKGLNYSIEYAGVRFMFVECMFNLSVVVL